VFGTPGVNSSAPEDAILSALEDAVSDGMDVINLSFGESVAGDLNADPFVQAVEAANALGVVVVASAGNGGPNPGTIGTPATAPHAIAVAASSNDRIFIGAVQTSGGGVIVALPGAGPNSFSPISGALIDVSKLDGNGLACNALPANSLNASVALILRGLCPFEVKLDNAQAAGAVAAVVYDNVPNENPIVMGVGAATLPAVMVANQDGLALQKQIGSGLAVTLQFYAPAHINPQSLAIFSSAGPNVNYSIKPDLTAVGENFYTAAETFDSAGELYDPSGYVITQGTSFSAPLISGAAALLKAARPGLTSDEYRSLLIDSADAAYSAPGTAARVQQAGGGFLNMLAALNATAAASPVSFSFGTAGGAVNVQQILTVTNTGSVTDTFQISASARDSGGPVPQFPTTAVHLGPGASAAVPVAFTADGLSPGQYEGFIAIQGAAAGTATNVPYWFGVPSGQAVYITVLNQTAASAAGSSVPAAVVFRVTDSAGLPVNSIVPSITAVSGGGSVLGVGSLGSAYPNDYGAGVRLGKQAGANLFQIQAGAVTITITITGQ
jgi:minor extracellular serine protease Vpr